MAAVLCRGLGQVCEAIGQVICLPCKACGLGCEAMGGICTSPFFPYLAVTFLCNLPPVVKTLALLPDFVPGNEWCGKGTNWLFVNAALCVIHMFAAMYLVQRIRDETPPPPIEDAEVVAVETPNDKGKSSSLAKVDTGYKPDALTKVESGTYYKADDVPMKPGAFKVQSGTSTKADAVPMTPGATTVSSSMPMSPTPFSISSAYESAPMTMRRIKDVLMEDPVIAVYLLLVAFWVIWQMIGPGRMFGIGDECGNVHGVLMLSIVCAWIYMGLVVCSFCMSLCCM